MKDELDSSRPLNIPTGPKLKEVNNAVDTTHGTKRDGESNNTFVLKGALKNARSPLSSEQGSRATGGRDGPKGSIMKRQETSSPDESRGGRRADLVRKNKSAITGKHVTISPVQRDLSLNNSKDLPFELHKLSTYTEKRGDK